MKRLLKDINIEEEAEEDQQLILVPPDNVALSDDEDLNVEDDIELFVFFLWKFSIKIIKRSKYT